MNRPAKSYRYYTSDVFSSSIFGGNPLAVVLDADDIDSATMQKIAREFNYSETTFVRTPGQTESDAAQIAGSALRFNVRIFTPERELPFAGHPTLGTAAVLAHCGRTPLRCAKKPAGLEHTEIILVEQVGDVAVSLSADEGAAQNDATYFARLRAARPIQFSPEDAPDREILARILSLEAEDIGAVDAQGNEYAVRGASTGIPSLNVPVRNRDILARARVRLDLWERHLKSSWAPDPYLFTFDAEDPDSQIRARKFALTAGIGEDPATGSAAVTLAGYLAEHNPQLRDTTDGEFDWRIEQGYEMGRPSILNARAAKANGKITSLSVGGDSVIVCAGSLRVPG
ncbi:MAG: PhzF family phenazine biosynthesis protein [bacterium]|nr:PhzF family phenazine biosynthesis protein [bacterium]